MVIVVPGVQVCVRLETHPIEERNAVEQVGVREGYNAQHFAQPGSLDFGKSGQKEKIR